MLRFHNTSTVKSITTLIASILLLASVPAVKAADGNAEANGSETRPRRVTAPPAEQTQGEQKPLRVAYVLYDQSLIAESSVESPMAADATGVGRLADTLPAPIPLPGAPPQTSSSVASTAPLSAGEKFGLWTHRFVSPGTYGSAAFSGLLNELRDNDDNKEDTVGNYFADSMTRAARSFAFGATAGFFEKAVLPSILHQDPRYHRSGKKGTAARMTYAITRVLITQGDRCACHQVNASFLIGAAGATAVSNLWERRERTGPGKTLSRFYTHVYLTALFNIIREFVSGQ